MASRREIFDKALKLPLGERAKLAHELLVSLDQGEPDPEAPEAWDREIEKRANDVKAGTAKTEPWPAARDRLKRDLLLARTRRAKR